MSNKTYKRVERSIITLMLLGMAGMFQPFSVEVYRYGFLLLLFSTIAFIIISHMSPKHATHEAAGPVSIEQAAEHLQGHDL